MEKKQKKVVIKIGSTLITDHGEGLNHQSLCDWAEQIAMICKQGHSVVLVSSGAVAEGVTRLNMKKRPTTLHELQAAAAVGQMGLVQSYESCFQRHQLHSAQVLLTHDDLSNRKRYLNARSTLKTLLEYGVVPVVNENDTVSNEEIRFGDNDTLAALVCNLIEADLLIILTDQQGLYDSNPQTNVAAKLIEKASANDSQLLSFAGSSGSTIGSGGMRTKIVAAQKAARSGTDTIIASGKEIQVIQRLLSGEEIGSYLSAEQEKAVARKQWLGSHLIVSGTLVLDAGASNALLNSGASLLSVGVKGVKGQFKRGDMVECITERGKVLAHGLINYSHSECLQLKGISSQKIQSILGYVAEPELIHRDNLIVF
ncbi:MAG: glutamate 5-kinase [Gammaproteobacteria bacterium]|nr:glutamate 5-kinase [Gammaproteobacteria bacterium]